MNIQTVLKELCLAPGVGGQTAAAETAERLLAAYVDKVEVTPLGNVTGVRRCGIEGAPLLLLEAHIDQIGFVVTGIEDGFVRVSACGGIDSRTLAAAEVVVWGDKPYPGVFASTPPHLASKDKTLPAINDRIIDVGMNQETAEQRIAVGSRVSFRSRLEPAGEYGLTGTALDDRAGVAAVLMALDICSREKPAVDIAACFSVQEELGMRGAGAGAFTLKPDMAIAVDVSFAHTPDADRRECGVLGGGPMIGLAPGLDDAMSRRLIELAGRLDIPFQREVMGGKTGTDADEIAVARGGVRTALLSVPQRYMHTPVELVDSRDVENTGRLMAAFAREGRI